MGEFRRGTQSSELDATKATARLPGLDIEIVHRRSPAGDAEQISINLQAVPSFEVFSRYLDAASLSTLWAQAAFIAWLPWLEAARAITLPWSPAVPRLKAKSEPVASTAEQNPSR